MYHEIVNYTQKLKVNDAVDKSVSVLCSKESHATVFIQEAMQSVNKIVQLTL